MNTLLFKNPAKLIALFLLAIMSATTFNGCSDDEEDPAPSGPAANEVWMQGTKFTPATRTVAVNTTVTWINTDGFNHNVVSDSSLFNSGNIAGGASFSHTFTLAGTYPYTCTLHSNMTGTIIVQ